MIRICFLALVGFACSSTTSAPTTVAVSTMDRRDVQMYAAVIRDDDYFVQAARKRISASGALIEKISKFMDVPQPVIEALIRTDKYVLYASTTTMSPLEFAAIEVSTEEVSSTSTAADLPEESTTEAASANAESSTSTESPTEQPEEKKLPTLVEDSELVGRELDLRLVLDQLASLDSLPEAEKPGQAVRQESFENIGIRFHKTRVLIRYNMSRDQDAHRKSAEEFWLDVFDEVYFRTVVLHASDLHLGQQYRDFATIARFLLEKLVHMSSNPMRGGGIMKASGLEDAFQPVIEVFPDCCGAVVGAFFGPALGELAASISRTICSEPFRKGLSNCCQCLISRIRTTTTPAPTRSPADILDERRGGLRALSRWINGEIEGLNEIIGRIRSLRSNQGSEGSQVEEEVQALTLKMTEIVEGAITVVKNKPYDFLLLQMEAMQADMKKVIERMHNLVKAKAYDALLEEAKQRVEQFRRALFTAALSSA
jgi:hypothetical protein